MKKQLKKYDELNELSLSWHSFCQVRELKPLKFVGLSLKEQFNLGLNLRPHLSKGLSLSLTEYPMVSPFTSFEEQQV